MAEIRKIKGSAYWVSYLINDDWSGLSDEEKDACDNWANIELLPEESVIDASEPFFSWHYDLHTHTQFKGGELVEYTLLKV